MKKNTIIPTMLVIVLLAGCSAQSQKPEEQAVKTVNVQTNNIQPEMFERYLRLVGTIESTNDINLSAEVAGRIERYFIEKGDYVEQGEAILQISDDKLQSRQTKLKAQTVQAREKYERLKRIFTQDSIGSEFGVIETRTNYQQSKAALEALEVDLQNTTVRAPFNGVVNEKFAELGEMASPGMPLVRLLGTGELKISAGVPSRFADVVSTGDQAKLWFDFQPGDTLQLPITYVSQSINPESRTFEIEIALPAETQSYKVDMSANVKLRTFTKDSAIVIGQEYVYPVEEHFVVYTLAENDSSETIANRQVVQTGAAYNNRIVIESGLNAGDKLITVGSSFLQDSMRVEVVTNQQKNLAQEN